MDISRRRFLRQLTVLSGTSLLPTVPLWADAIPLWVAVGPAANFAKDKFTRVVLPAEQQKAVVYITRSADDSFLALSARCTHKGCEVTWDRDSKEFVCPCHNGQFDAKGQRTGGPPRKPLPAFPTRIDADGQLSLLISHQT